MRYVLLPAIAALLLSACAPRYAPDARTEAERQKGLSAQNVAWFLVFWPGIVGNEYNNSLVIQKADEHCAQLNALYIRKGCR